MTKYKHMKKYSYKRFSWPNTIKHRVVQECYYKLLIEFISDNRKLSIAKKFISVNLSGGALLENRKTLINSGIKDFIVFTPELNKKMRNKMSAIKYKNSKLLKNFHITEHEFFKFISMSNLKFISFEYDTTCSIQKTLKLGFYENFEKLIMSNNHYCKFGFTFLYERNHSNIGKTTNKDKILMKLISDLNAICRKHGYSMLWATHIICDGRPMQYVELFIRKIYDD